MKSPAFQRFSGRTKRFRQRVGMHIYILPNLLTTGNMFFGFYGIIHAIRGDFERAAYAIVAAAVFDLLDGRVARLTRSTSQFGAEYDSLSDMVSFGLAPGVILYLWALQPFSRLGWIASFVYVACVALRLARFNVQSTTVEKSHFQGLPSPMGAGIVASSVLAFQDLNLEAGRSYIILAMALLLAFVMVSNFPYRNFKDLDLKKRLPFRYLVAGVMVFIAVASRPEVMLFVLFIGYAILGAVFGLIRGTKPISIRGPNPQITQEDDLHEEILEEDEKLVRKDEGGEIHDLSPKI